MDTGWFGRHGEGGVEYEGKVGEMNATKERLEWGGNGVDGDVKGM